VIWHSLIWGLCQGHSSRKIFEAQRLNLCMLMHYGSIIVEWTMHSPSSVHTTYLQRGDCTNFLRTSHEWSWGQVGGGLNSKSLSPLIKLALEFCYAEWKQNLAVETIKPDHVYGHILVCKNTYWSVYIQTQNMTVDVIWFCRLYCDSVFILRNKILAPI